MNPRRTLLGAALALLVAIVLGGCGRQYETDPHALLSEARATVDATDALHFALSSSNATGSSLFISGGEGDAKRPDGFAGRFQVATNGILLPVEVVSLGGVFRARLSLGGAFEKVDPAKFGFSDPGRLIAPKTGLSSLLSHAHSASLRDRDRLGGEELYEVAVSLPGDQVEALLTSADPSRDVSGQVGIDVDTHQVRRVTLVGPFFEKGHDSTYTLTLTNYGEQVSVTAPPG